MWCGIWLRRQAGEMLVYGFSATADAGGWRRCLLVSGLPGKSD